MKYNELKIHGEHDFPIALYNVDHSNPKYEMACHYHSDIELIRVINGTLKLSLNNQTYIAKNGEIFFVNSDVLHSAIPNDCVYQCIVFNPTFFLNLPQKDCITLLEDLNNHNTTVNTIFSTDTPEIFSQLTKLFETLSNLSVSGAKLEITGILYNIFALILKNNYYTQTISQVHSEGEKKREKLKKVLSYIRSNYDAPLSLEDMATVAGMSEKYFCAFFKKATNKTPVEYLISYRIECSARQLLHTDQSITDIAYSCGFNDLSYFIKTFKSQKGTTPSAFRR